jgi:hypothetical protein
MSAGSCCKLALLEACSLWSFVRSYTGTGPTRVTVATTSYLVHENDDASSHAILPYGNGLCSLCDSFMSCLQSNGHVGIGQPEAGI